MHYIIKRKSRITSNIPFKVGVFIDKHLRAISLACLLVISLVLMFTGGGKASGAVEFYNDSPVSKKPIDPKLLGDYTMVVDMSDISSAGTREHKRIGSQYAYLAGIKPVGRLPTFIPKTHKTNWSVILGNMWDNKLSRPNVSPASRAWATRIVMRYADNKRDTKSAIAYVSQVDTAVHQMNDRINYTALCSKLNIRECDNLQKTMSRVRGQNIAAYGMTELFPSTDGEFNYKMMDMILKNAGENYLHAIPSQGDDLLSTGIYQFTSYAIRRDDSGKLGAVNFVDNFAGRRLSGSVAHLKQRDAHRAAFAFATYNIAMVFRGLNHADADRLATKCSVDGLTQAIAVAHHMPGPAYESTRRWVRSGCSKSIQSFLGPHLKMYAQKTETNLHAIIHNSAE